VFGYCLYSATVPVLPIVRELRVTSLTGVGAMVGIALMPVLLIVDQTVLVKFVDAHHVLHY
jgi:hypothetical protein